MAGVRSVYQALSKAAKAATDTFLVYYAGHGLTSMRRNELYLCLADTDPDELSVSGLSIDTIREVFLDCPARNRILVLDCCFSGRAAHDYMASTSELLAGQSEITGTYTLASAPPTAASLAPPGERYTTFTGALIEMLRDGEPSGPELLTLDVLYWGLRRRMNARGFPLPTQRGTDLAHHLAMGRNPAHSLHTTEVSDRSPVRAGEDSRPSLSLAPSPAGSGAAVPPPAELQASAPAVARSAAGSLQADSREVLSPPLRTRSRDWLGVSGLLLMLVSAVVQVIGWAESQSAMPTLLAAAVYATDAIPMIAALVALAAGGLRRLLLPAVLGAWLTSIGGFVGDILYIPAYHVFSLVGMLGDALATAAVIILFFAVRKISKRGRWAMPRVLLVLLFGGVVVSTGISCTTQALELYFGAPGHFFAGYPQIVESIVDLATALFAAWLALGLEQRLPGGMLLLGWTVSQTLGVLSWITQGIRFSGGMVAANWVTVLLLVATGCLAIAYMRRTEANSRPRPGTWPG